MASKLLLVLAFASIALIVVASASDEFDVEMVNDDGYKRDPDLIIGMEDMEKRGKGRPL